MLSFKSHAWWNGLNREQQVQYLKDHPKSRFKGMVKSAFTKSTSDASKGAKVFDDWAFTKKPEPDTWEIVKKAGHAIYAGNPAMSDTKLNNIWAAKSYDAQKIHSNNPESPFFNHPVTAPNPNAVKPLPTMEPSKMSHEDARFLASTFLPKGYKSDSEYNTAMDYAAFLIKTKGDIGYKDFMDKLHLMYGKMNDDEPDDAKTKSAYVYKLIDQATDEKNNDDFKSYMYNKGPAHAVPDNVPEPEQHMKAGVSVVPHIKDSYLTAPKVNLTKEQLTKLREDAVRDTPCDPDPLWMDDEEIDSGVDEINPALNELKEAAKKAYNGPADGETLSNLEDLIVQKTKEINKQYGYQSKQGIEMRSLVRGIPGPSVLYYKWNEPFQDQLDELTNEERNAAKGYKGSDYGPWNSYLRKKSTPEAWQSHDLDEEIDNFSGAIKKFKLPSDMKFFRGKNDNYFWKKNLKVGNTFTDKGFTSVTLSKGIAKAFASERPVMFEITVPKGSAAMPLDTFRIYPYYGASHRECEYVLDKASRFRVDSYTVEPREFGGVWPIWHLTLLPPEETA